MKRIRIVGLCLVAVFAFSAMVASSASAGTYKWCQPMKKGEYTTSSCATKSAKAKKGHFEIKAVEACAAQKKGEYTTNTCTTKSAKAKKGHFEKTTGRKYTATTLGANLATPALGPNAVECSASTTVGEITGPKTDVQVVTFTGCQLEGKKCESTALFGNGTPSGIAGVIITNKLDSKLVDNGEKAGGYKHEEPPVGHAWDELVSSEHEPYSSEFICGGTIILRTHGSVSGDVSPVNTFGKTTTVTFTPTGGAEQALLTEVFNGTEFIPPGGAPTSEETVGTNVGETAMEVVT
jgi:hypothetical protein